MRLRYQPIGLLVSILRGLLAGALFKRLWRAVADQSDVPNAKDRDRSWREVIAAPAMRGAVLGGVKALIDRAGATWFAQLTGVWPGKTRTKDT
jgi:hypothetical protein